MCVYFIDELKVLHITIMLGKEENFLAGWKIYFVNLKKKKKKKKYIYIYIYIYIFLLFIQNISPFLIGWNHTRIILHNQLLFTKFGKKLRHIESMTSKGQPAADHWTNDVKSAARCRLLNRWPKKTGDQIVLFLLVRKWLRVGLEVWAKKILPS